MAVIQKTYTFTAGTAIVASEHNTNYDTLYNEINGNLDNANIKANAGIVDSKLAQITTAGKVSGASLTSLGSVPTGGGTLPAKNGGTGGDLSAAAQGAIPFFSATGICSALAAGTSGHFLKALGAGADPVFSAIFAGIKDYGTSASSSTDRLSGVVYVAWGTISSVANKGSQAVTNLPFTSTDSYVAVCVQSTSVLAGLVGPGAIIRNSGSQMTVYNASDTSYQMSWIAIGT